MSVKFEVYVDAIAEELDRIVDLGNESPNLLILSRPGWRMNDLTDELADRIGRWIEALSDISRTSDPDGPARDLDQGSELMSVGDSLLGTLRNLESSALPDDAGDLWDKHPVAVGTGVARLAAMTCAVFRSDIERSAGRRGRIEIELAVDGVEERLETYCAAVESGEIGPWDGTMCLVALDAPDAWMVEGRRGRCAWRKGRGPAVAAVVGHASDLLLFAWGRLSPDDLTVTGDFRVASAWPGVPE